MPPCALCTFCPLCTLVLPVADSLASYTLLTPAWNWPFMPGPLSTTYQPRLMITIPTCTVSLF